MINKSLLKTFTNVLVVAALFLLNLPLVGQQSKTQKGASDECIVYGYLQRGKDEKYTTFISKETVDPKKTGKVNLKRSKGAELPYSISITRRMRPTSTGTVIAPHAGGVFEFDSDGKVVWEHKCPNALSAHVLANGNILIAVVKEDVKVEVTETDRKGTTIRQTILEVSPAKSVKYGCVWAVGEDRLLALIEGKVFEFDWKGKKYFECKPEGHCMDIAPLPNGNFVAALKTQPPKGKDFAGKVVEINREGKEIWSVEHECPTAVQPLANGNLLVTGG
jgi:hypothetical protein